LSPPAISLGMSATSTIRVSALNGFNSPVALTCLASPTTAHPPTCSFSPTSVTPATPSTLTVSTASSTTPANYILTVTGSSAPRGSWRAEVYGLSLPGPEWRKIIARVEQTLSRRVPAIAATFGRRFSQRLYRRRVASPHYGVISQEAPPLVMNTSPGKLSRRIHAFLLSRCVHATLCVAKTHRGACG
jgi:hypothetical protein